LAKMTFTVSPKRYGIVLEDIRSGSEPQVRFYIMVAVSTMIAALGLIINSTAVIIGAMLVAPLMTPIFGIALALIRGNTILLGKALQAEIAGVALAVLMGFFLGYVYPALTATPEMIARTEPQLFDLLVAVFSGFAGAYAMLDEKISPALPGVAIATAIVPPLANAGLCFSAGAYGAGIGSFLLFFANFLSILLVASITFWLFGMAGSYHDLNRATLVKRFGLPIVGFVIVAAFLTNTLVKMSHNHQLNEMIQTTLEEEVENLPYVSLERKRFSKSNHTLYVVADMNSSTIITPTQVTRMQEKLEKNIGLETELVVRSNMAREISALGSMLHSKKQGLDGSLTTSSVNPLVQKTKLSETLIRDHLTDFLGYELVHVRVLNIYGKHSVIAAVAGFLPPGRDGIEELEAKLRIELQDPEVKLIIRFIETKLYDKTGNRRIEFSGLAKMTGEQEIAIETISNLLKKEIAVRPELSIAGINQTIIDNTYYFLVDVKGVGMFSPAQIAAIQDRIETQTGLNVKVHVYFQSEMVVTQDGATSYEEVARQVYQRQEKAFKSDVQKIIEASNL